VAGARRFVVEQLPEHSRAAADEIILMVSELATNAVKHVAAAFDVTVTVDLIGSLVRVEVRDPSDTTPARADFVDDAPNGRGLSIVAALADAWGIEMRRGRPGKTVWFTAALPIVPHLAGEMARGGDLLAPEPVWPGRAVRTVLDGLSDAVIATDSRGTVVYANDAAEELTGWPDGTLRGRNATELAPDARTGMEGGLSEALRDDAPDVIGRRLPTAIKRADGTHIDTDLVLSVVNRAGAGRVVLGIFRARDDRRVQRWSELTSELLELLADAPIDDPPAERLLSTLGRRLGWDVTTLWSLSADHELVCRHVWTRTASTAPAFAREKADDPKSGSEGLPRYVIEHNEPLWVPDLSRDDRFLTDALMKDGLKSAYAFPVRYHGACVGIVKMLSRESRERDSSVVELMEAVSGHLGELLHASAQRAERQQLLDELLEARRRNEFLLLATQVLSQVVDYTAMVERLAEISVPVMADLCLIDIVDDEGRLQRMAAWHADPAKRALADRLRTEFPPDPDGLHPIFEVMQSGRSKWSADMSDDYLRLTTRDAEHLAVVKALGFTSFMTVPLRLADQQVLGTVTLVSAGSGRRFSERDLGLAEQLAKQVSAVVIRTRAFDTERRISHELQRNMLPDAIPTIGGWDVAVRYLPAAVGVEVGGDWYDVIPINDRLVALVVGDVEGHDLDAAKIMSRLRHTLGLLLLEEHQPGTALERLNRVLLTQDSTRLATALIGVLDTDANAITFASAGHHSPLHIDDGQVDDLGIPPGPPLGVQSCRYVNAHAQLGEGCLLMFTDGLVERRDESLEERLELLHASLRTSPSVRPEALADHIVQAMTDDLRSTDDIVLLTACRAEGTGDCLS
jgi:PAS domain S-box-containing protein